MPEPAVVVAMREFKAGLLAREHAQMQYMARRWLTVERRLDGDIQMLARELGEAKEAGLSYGRGKLYQMERYKQLQAQAQREIRQYVGWADDTISSGQEDMIRRGVGDAAQAIQLSYYPQIGPHFERLPLQAVQHMVGITAEGKPVGALLKRRMLPGTSIAGWQQLCDELVHGTALGRNPRETALAMRDALSSGLDKALVIARSEQMRVYRQASLDQYQESEVVIGQKRLTAHDGRVCAACLADDATLYTLEAAINDHPNGRCTPVPVVQGMPEVTWRAGEDWLLTQPEAIQRSILRGERYQEWKDGRFAFQDLIVKKRHPTWGESLGVRSVQSLREQGLGSPKAITDEIQRITRERIVISGRRRKLEGLIKRTGHDPAENVTVQGYKGRLRELSRERKQLTRQGIRLKAAGPRKVIYQVPTKAAPVVKDLWATKSWEAAAKRATPRGAKAGDRDRLTKALGKDLQKMRGGYVSHDGQAEAKRQVVYNLSQATGLPSKQVNEMVHQWAATSNDFSLDSLEMQQEAAKLFDVPASSFSINKLRDLKEGVVEAVLAEQRGSTAEEKQVFLKTMYEDTQKWLRGAGYKSGDRIRLYRGASRTGWEGLRDKQWVELRGNALESWSLEDSTAMSFAHPKQGAPTGAVFSMDVPIELIVSTPRTGIGCMNETEFVILGSQKGMQGLVYDIFRE